MDIIGITEGLKKIKEPSNIVIYLSNGYVIDTLTKGWLEKWKKNGFKKKKHVDLWKELDKVLQGNTHAISYKHSKDVKCSKEFRLAEQIGKTMSGKENLPNDLKTNDNGDGLFAVVGETQSEILEIEDNTPILESICVDASTIENPGVTEYRGVDTKTRQVLFQQKYDEATNNIGEFLAMVLALALYKNKEKNSKLFIVTVLTPYRGLNKKSVKQNMKRLTAAVRVDESQNISTEESPDRCASLSNDLQTYHIKLMG